MELLLQINGLASWHSILVHFPIVLFSLTLMLDILAAMGLISFKPGAWTLALGLLFLIPALITGWEASHAFPKEDPAVQSHMLRAFFLTPYAMLYTIMRFFGKPAPALIYVVLSLVLVGLTWWTSDFSGILSRIKV